MQLVLPRPVRGFHPSTLDTSRGHAALATALMLVLGGSCIGLSTFLPAGPFDARGVGTIRLLSLTAVLAGLLAALLRSRFNRMSHHLLLLLASGLILASVVAAGSASAALPMASLFIVVTLHAFYLLPARQAVIYPAISLILGGWALWSNPGVGASQLWIRSGVGVSVAFIAWWLVRGAAAAEQDHLTKLPNRRGFERLLGEQMLRHAADGQLCVGLLDLASAGRNPASYGGTEGRENFVRAVDRWRRSLPASIVLAHLGGSEFALLAPRRSTEQVAAMLAEVNRAEAPNMVCTAGLTMLEAPEGSEDILRRAGGALHLARRAGHGEIRSHALAYASVTNIRRSLERDEFSIVYQPIVDVRTTTVVGAEALVRWNHGLRGSIAPSEFIPQAELEGSIEELGRWIMHQAVKEAAAWDAGEEPGRQRYVSVNVSGRELRDPGYSTMVLGALQRYRLPASRLRLEVLESEYGAASETFRSTVRELKGAGVRIAVDDFGVGYSSLDRITSVQADILKIDRSFIAGIGHEDDTAPLPATIIALGRSLLLDVVAEGVETVEQAEWLKRRRCYFAQGFLYSQPARAADFAEICERIEAGV